MSQVVEMQAEEIRQLRQTTARLEAKLARRKAANRESRQLVEELREREREAEQEHARRKRRKVEELAATSTSTSTTTTGASLHSITSSSLSSSPSPSSTSSPLAVPVNAHAAIGGLQSEIYRRMPFLRDYDIRASAIINFRYTAHTTAHTAKHTHAHTHMRAHTHHNRTHTHHNRTRAWLIYCNRSSVIRCVRLSYPAPVASPALRRC
jgi:hypothetical protein